MVCSKAMLYTTPPACGGDGSELCEATSCHVSGWAPRRRAFLRRDLRTSAEYDGPDLKGNASARLAHSVTEPELPAVGRGNLWSRRGPCGRRSSRVPCGRRRWWGRQASWWGQGGPTTRGRTVTSWLVVTRKLGRPASLISLLWPRSIPEQQPTRRPGWPRLEG